MSLKTPQSKKTLGNEFNILSSSDSREINADVNPIISPSWNLPLATELGSAVNLGSARNPWAQIYASNWQLKFPSLSECIGGALNPPTQNPLAIGAFFYITSGTPTTRIVWFHNRSTWTNVTNSLPIGTMFYHVGDLRLYIYAGSAYGWRSSFQGTNPWPTSFP